MDSTDTRKAHAQLLHIPRRLPGELTDSGQGRPTAQVRADSPHTHGSPARRGCLPHIRDISAVRPMSARSAAHTPGAQAPTLGVDERAINSHGVRVGRRDGITSLSGGTRPPSARASRAATSSPSSSMPSGGAPSRTVTTQSPHAPGLRTRQRSQSTTTGSSVGSSHGNHLLSVGSMDARRPPTETPVTPVTPVVRRSN